VVVPASCLCWLTQKDMLVTSLPRAKWYIQHSIDLCLLKTAVMQIPSFTMNDHLLDTMGHYRQAGRYTGSGGIFVWIGGEFLYYLEFLKGTVGVCRALSVTHQV